MIEMLVVMSLVVILAGIGLAQYRNGIVRAQEAVLREDLFRMKDALDQYYADKSHYPPGLSALVSEGYPPDLDTLVEGVTMANDASGRKLKFLRRVPLDPITSSTDWGLRAYTDEPDSLSWGGKSVFDVYTRSGATALDGTKYRDW